MGAGGCEIGEVGTLVVLCSATSVLDAHEPVIQLLHDALHASNQICCTRLALCPAGRPLECFTHTLGALSVDNPPSLQYKMPECCSDMAASHVTSASSGGRDASKLGPRRAAI